MAVCFVLLVAIVYCYSSMLCVVIMATTCVVVSTRCCLYRLGLPCVVLSHIHYVLAVILLALHVSFLYYLWQ